MSVLTEAEIVNGLVLVAVLLSDVGPRRKINAMRLLRPVVVAIVIIPLFMHHWVTQSGGLAVEAAGLVAGLVLGLLALALMRVYRDKNGKPLSAAGWGYALLWIIVIAARALFSYGAFHWFETPLVHWMVSNTIPYASITNGLIFMAVAMLLARTVGLGIRGRAAKAVTAQTASDSKYSHV